MSISSGCEPCNGGDVAICFTGSGLMSTYQLGVAQYLYEQFDLTNVQYTACSGGAGPAVTLLLGAEPSTVLTTFFNHIIPMMKRSFLPSSLPLPHVISLNLQYLSRSAADFTKQLVRNTQDGWAKIKSGRLHIQISYVTWKKWRLRPELEGHLINDFTSLEDLEEAVTCTTSIPSVTCPPIPHTFRGRYAIDGGLIDAAPRPPRSSAEGGVATLVISPFIWRRPNASWFVKIGNKNDRTKLFGYGYQDALHHRHEIARFLHIKTKLHTYVLKDNTKEMVYEEKKILLSTPPAPVTHEEFIVTNKKITSAYRSQVSRLSTYLSGADLDDEDSEPPSPVTSDSIVPESDIFQVVEPLKCTTAN